VAPCARGQGVPRRASPDSTFGVEDSRFLPTPAPRVRLPDENWHIESSASHLPPPPGWRTSQFASSERTSGGSPKSDPLLLGDELTMESGRVSSHKSGFFQKLAFNSGWIYRGGGNNWGVIENELLLTVALPLPSRDYPLLITSGFDAVLLNGPSAPDLPARLYDGYLDFMWLPKLSERWLGILSVAPGVYSDFDSLQDDAFRVKAKALVRFDLVPEQVQVLLGVLYLNRDDVNWLPAGGVIWDPNDDVHLELVFPRPQFAYRLTRGGLFEDWGYLAGEFGGDTWSIRRGVDEFDMMTSVDWRLFLGLERRRPGGAAQRVEVGYVFGREIKFDSPSPDVSAGDTFMVRAGVDF
ncbi:MAG: hypothetical protein ACODAD_13375, partial [Planctomycetota bacterium]